MIQKLKANFVFVMSFRESNINMIFTLNISVSQYDTDKKKGNPKGSKTLENETRVKQAIQTLSQHSLSVFPSGNLISTDSQDL